MKREELKLYRERLLDLRAQLRGDVDQMTRVVFEKPMIQAMDDSPTMPSHMAEAASGTFEREFTLTLMEAKDQTLAQIETALERMEDGVYGICEACQARIPKARLNAIPYATYCVDCASQPEFD